MDCKQAFAHNVFLRRHNHPPFRLINAAISTRRVSSAATTRAHVSLVTAFSPAAIRATSDRARPISRAIVASFVRDRRERGAEFGGSTQHPALGIGQRLREPRHEIIAEPNSRLPQPRDLGLGTFGAAKMQIGGFLGLG
jgi:hypothetical protein